MLNGLSIDLEDWYQGLTSTSRRIDLWPSFEDRIVESTGLLLELLAQADVKATFFVLGYVADQFPQLVRKIADAGHEIGLHSYHHQKISQLTRDQFRTDTARGLEAVEKASGRRVVGYRAPMFSITRAQIWALEVLYEMGFKYDSSVFPIRNGFYGFPEAPRYPFRPFKAGTFVEFPLSTVRFLAINWPVAGGFYLRLLPYALLKRGLKRINSEGKPAIVYLHPWDLDPAQPRPEPTLRERFTHYHNLNQTRAKLTTLLQDFHFTTLINLLEDETLSGQRMAWTLQK